MRMILILGMLLAGSARASSPATLFVNSCSVDKSAGTFVCSPVKLSWDGQSADGFTRSSLGKIALSVDVSNARSYEPTLKSSAADLKAHKIYWHGGCSSEFFVTDLNTGLTERNPIDPKKIGLPDSSRGVCLAEIVYDTKRGFAVALGGRSITGEGKTPAGTSVEFALRLGADGSYTLLKNLTGDVAQTFNFLHDFQSVASYDPGDDTVLAPIFVPSDPQNTEQRRQWLSFGIESGTVSFIEPGGSGVQNQFYDPTLKKRVLFNCDLPGLIDLQQSVVLNFGNGALRAAGIPQACEGFVGAGYDPQSRTQYMILRKGTIGSASDPLYVGVADLNTGNWGAPTADGLIKSGLTAGDLGWGTLGNDHLFESVDFVDAPSRPLLADLGETLESCLATATPRTAGVFDTCGDDRAYSISAHWALMRISNATGDPQYARQAIQLLDPGIIAQNANLLSLKNPGDTNVANAWFLSLAIEFEKWAAKSGEVADPRRLRAAADFTAHFFLKSFEANRPRPDNSGDHSVTWILDRLYAYFSFTGDQSSLQSLDHIIAGLLADSLVEGPQSVRIAQGFALDFKPTDDYFSIYGNFIYLFAKRGDSAALKTFLAKWPIDIGSLGSVDLGVAPGPDWLNMDWNRAWAFGMAAAHVSDPELASALVQARAASIGDGTRLYQQRKANYAQYGQWVPPFAVYSLTEDPVE